MPIKDYYSFWLSLIALLFGLGYLTENPVLVALGTGLAVLNLTDWLYLKYLEFQKERERKFNEV